MTEEKNPPTPRAGIFIFLGKRKQQRRAFHIPTAPATTARLVQNLNPKGASSTTVQTPLQAHSSIGKDCISKTRSASTGEGARPTNVTANTKAASFH